MTLLDIVWPTIAFVLLIFAVWLTLFIMRMRHMKANPATPADFADGESSLRYFAPVEMPSNNLKNLFEMPVLYFALVPLLLALGLDSFVQAIVAWVFVLLRAAHSYVHIARKPVPTRFMLYLLSCVALSAMWVGFVVDYASTAVTTGID